MENLNDQEPREVRPVEAGRREHGLRLLARMIAQIYARDIELLRKTDREPNTRYCGGSQVTDRQFEKAKLKKAVRQGIGGKEGES